MMRRGVSEMLAAVILIAIVLAGGVFLMFTFTNIFNTSSTSHQVQVVGDSLVSFNGNQAVWSIDVKNTGSSPIDSLTGTIGTFGTYTFPVGQGKVLPGETVSLTATLNSALSSDRFPVTIVAHYSDGSSVSYTTDVQVTY